MKTACTLKEARAAIQEEMPLVVCCDLDLPDGTAMELFHTPRRVAGMFQMKNPPVRLLPFFILTENNDLATEYEYRHEGVNDYITAPRQYPGADPAGSVLCGMKRAYISKHLPPQRGKEKNR